MHKAVQKNMLICVSVLACIATLFIFTTYKSSITIGILHSLTGNLAISEKPMVDATILAIEEINAQGGIHGRKIIGRVVDCKSDETIFAQEAERLAKDHSVAMIIGGWTSASCRAIQPISEKYGLLYIYPVTYEGITDSPTIFYTGATHNQQIIPAALWSYYNLGKNFFLVGSEEIFSSVSNAIITQTLKTVNATVVGAEYLPLSSTKVDHIIEKIISTNPDVIINTIQGSGNIAFFSELRKKGITPEKIPVMSIASVSETELVGIGNNALSGDYATASYFQSIDREENSVFVANFKKRFGPERVVSESVESAYISMHLWAQAANRASDLTFTQVKKNLYNTVFNAPEAIVYVDNKQLNTWKPVYVGKLRADGQFTVIWTAGKNIEPLELPLFMKKEQWRALIQDRYAQWGNRWSKMD